MIRRLHPIEDESLLREAFEWDAYAPSWYADSDSIFRPGSIEEYLQLAKGEDQIDVGVFDEDLVGLITISRRGDKIYEAHLSAKRGTNVEFLAEAGFQVREQLFEIGMNVGFVWVAQKNLHVKKLCELVGFLPDGLMMLRGSYNVKMLDGTIHYKPIEWVRMRTTRNQWESEQRMAA